MEGDRGKPLQRGHRGSTNPRGRKGSELFKNQNEFGERLASKVERGTK